MEYTDSKQNAAKEQNSNGQFFPERIERSLQRSSFCRCIVKKIGDFTDFCAHANVSNDDFTAAVGDKAAGKDHISAVAKSCLFGNRVDDFIRTEAFTGQGTFIDFKTGAFNDPPISGNDITGFQKNDIARNQFSGRELHDNSVTKYGRFWRR